MINIRTADINDAELILALIKELASYEKLEHRVVATLEDVVSTLFSENPRAYVLLAEDKNDTVGFVLYHSSYSTFLCKQCIHIEDLYVREHYRGNGYGESLVNAICKIAYEQDCGRVDWVVLDWNKPAIDFYHHIGAEECAEWKIFRLNTPDIKRIATKNK